MIWPKEELFHTVGKKRNRLPWEAVMLWKWEKVGMEKEFMRTEVEQDGLLPHLSLCDDLLGQAGPISDTSQSSWVAPEWPRVEPCVLMPWKKRWSPWWAV